MTVEKQPKIFSEPTYQFLSIHVEGNSHKLWNTEHVGSTIPINAGESASCPKWRRPLLMSGAESSPYFPPNSNKYYSFRFYCLLFVIHKKKIASEIKCFASFGILTDGVCTKNSRQNSNVIFNFFFIDIQDTELSKFGNKWVAS